MVACNTVTPTNTKSVKLILVLSLFGATSLIHLLPKPMPVAALVAAAAVLVGGLLLFPFLPLLLLNIVDDIEVKP